MHHVHCILDKLLLDWADEQPEDVLDGEEDDDEVVDEVDDGHDDRVVGLALLVLLQLLDGGHYECNSGYEHHGQGEECTESEMNEENMQRNHIWKYKQVIAMEEKTEMDEEVYSMKVVGLHQF